MDAQREFDAFLSYASVPDERLVRRTRRFLTGFHRQRLLRSLRLKPLAICLDGQDFKLRAGNRLEAVEETLRSYVGKAQYLIVFCSAGAVKSAFVNREIALFLEDHAPAAVLPVVTEGNPAAAPELVFPQALIERGLHQVIWLDFRGARTWFWQRRNRRIRPFAEERARLAVTLYGEAPSIMPTWKRARAIRRAVGSVLAAGGLLIGSAWWLEAERNRAREQADVVVQEIANPGEASSIVLRTASIRDLQRRAAEAARLFHVFETDRAYREAASLTLRRVATAAPLTAPHLLAGSQLWRLGEGGVEAATDAAATTWEVRLPGRFTAFDANGDGTVAAAVNSEGEVAVWRQGRMQTCPALPAGSAPRVLAVDPAGVRIAVLLQTEKAWDIAIAPAGACAVDPWSVHTLWQSEPESAAGAALHSAPRLDRMRVRLNRGGTALVASSDAGWMVAAIEPSGARLSLLNAVLERHFADDVRTIVAERPEPPLLVADEAFSADGAYIAVAAIRDDGLELSAGPRTVVMSLADGATVGIDASRGNRRVAMSGHGTRLAFTSGYFVRVTDWSIGREVSSTPMRASVSALAFAASDRLLLIADREVQPRLHVVDVTTGRRLGRAESALVQELRRSNGEAERVLAVARDGARLYEVRALPGATRFPAEAGTSAAEWDGGVALSVGEDRLVPCSATSAVCADPVHGSLSAPDAAMFGRAGDVVLYRRGAGACVGVSDSSAACVALPVRERALLAGGVARGGSIAAVAFAREDGGETHSVIEVYRRTRTPRFPWLGVEYVRQAAIEEPGDIRALGFSRDGSWLASASHWQKEWVVRRFPVSGPAIFEDAERHE